MVVLITGASSGIGRALALEHASRGDNVVLFARREAELQSLAKECEKFGVKALFCVGSVSNQSDLDLCVKTAMEKFGSIDIVYANAGIAISGNLAVLSDQELAKQLDANLYGVLRTVRATLSQLRASRGRMAIVGSAMSYISIAGSGAYSMSKYAVRALADTLRLEERKISVTLICPGFIETEILYKNNEGTKLERKKDEIPAYLVMPASTAATQMAKAVLARKKEVAITFHAKLIIFIERHFPWLTYRLLRLLSRK